MKKQTFAAIFVPQQTELAKMLTALQQISGGDEATLAVQDPAWNREYLQELGKNACFSQVPIFKEDEDAATTQWFHATETFGNRLRFCSPNIEDSRTNYLDSDTKPMLEWSPELNVLKKQAAKE